MKLSDPFKNKKCKTLSADIFASLTKEEKYSLRKFKMLQRRDEQRNRVPDLDSRIVHFSKNSLPEYRKDCVRDYGTA